MKYKSKYTGWYIVLPIAYWMLNCYFYGTLFFALLSNLVPFGFLAVFIYERKAERKFEQEQGREPVKIQRGEIITLLIILAAILVGIWNLLGR